jgi:PiT family inorganic phosphate transporter
MIDTHTLLIVVIAVALVFDFLNGFHDAANTIATIVVTRTLTPLQAVIIAGFANFIGYFTFGTAVANTIGKGVVHIDYVTLHLILATLMGAALWNLITWLLGLPTSSSHALIGGLIGAGIAAAGPKVVIVGGLVKIIAFIFLAPIIGGLAAFAITAIIMRIAWKSHPTKSDAVFKRLQLLSSVFMSFGHGTNDAQKTMGIIALALFSAGVNKSFQLDNWVVLSCYSAIAIGTTFGGWRIVKTMGTGITKIRAMHGFASGVASSLVLIGTAHFGIPVSTTHVIGGSLFGVGAVESLGKVRWITARRIVWAWFLTIPLTAACSALCYLLVGFFVR